MFKGFPNHKLGLPLGFEKNPCEVSLDINLNAVESEISYRMGLEVKVKRGSHANKIHLINAKSGSILS